jgi:hypothetical protein
VSDDFVQSVDQKICEIWRFTISEPFCELPLISCIVLYKITTVRLSYHKLCTIWVPKMLMGSHKMKRMALAFTFFRGLPKRWQSFSQSHCTSDNDETWVSFVHVETKEQSK